MREDISSAGFLINTCHNQCEQHPVGVTEIRNLSLMLQFDLGVPMIETENNHKSAESSWILDNCKKSGVPALPSIIDGEAANTLDRSQPLTEHFRATNEPKNHCLHVSGLWGSWSTWRQPASSEGLWPGVVDLLAVRQQCKPLVFS